MSFFRLSIFKQTRHNRFSYQPIYYDPVKEELAQRVKSIQAENEEYGAAYRRLKISSEFTSIRKNSAIFGRKQKAKSRVRFILILILLSYICYWVLTRV